MPAPGLCCPSARIRVWRHPASRTAHPVTSSKPRAKHPQLRDYTKLTRPTRNGCIPFNNHLQRNIAVVRQLYVFISRQCPFPTIRRTRPVLPRSGTPLATQHRRHARHRNMPRTPTDGLPGPTDSTVRIPDRPDNTLAGQPDTSARADAADTSPTAPPAARGSADQVSWMGAPRIEKPSGDEEMDVKAVTGAATKNPEDGPHAVASPGRCPHGACADVRLDAAKGDGCAQGVRGDDSCRFHAGRRDQRTMPCALRRA